MSETSTAVTGPALRRGQQRAAGRAAGQVGDRAVRQVQGQRRDRDRMGLERGSEPGPVPLVPAPPVRMPGQIAFRLLRPAQANP